MARMTPGARRLRVGSAASAPPAAGAPAREEPRDLEVAAVVDAVEWIGPGEVVVRGPDASHRRAWIGATEIRPTGETRVEVVVDGWRFEIDVEDADRADLRRRATRSVDAEAASGPAEIRAIIPGRVGAVRVAVGDVVEAGQTLMVVEAMKMQNELRASQPGTVERIAVAEGETIDTGDVLVVVR
jgi:biotin carboxyl carrier protein